MSLFEKIKNDFPMLAEKVIYLDSAATTLKPKCVAQAVEHYYTKLTTNVHRAIHPLAEEATRLYEESRLAVQNFIHAESVQEIIFTKGTTESINLVARSYGEHFLQEGDEILITQMEHHANIIPWQMLAQRKKLILKYIPLQANGELDLSDLPQLLTSKTKLFCFTAASNTLGTLNDLPFLIQKAKEVGAKTLIDGAQIVAHHPVNVSKLDCDFFVFSAHKLFGPTGLGVLYGKKDLLEQMPPFLGGGDMIDKVTMQEATYNDLPYKFEAGTPAIAQVMGFKAALDYLQGLDWAEIEKEESELLAYAHAQLNSLPQVEIYGKADRKVSLISFNLKNIHSQDAATVLAEHSLALRSGHHCTQPILQFYQVSSTLRLSLSFYNQKSDIDHLIKALKKVIDLFEG